MTVPQIKSHFKSKKSILSFLLTLFIFSGNAQVHQLNETDTSLHYKSTFYHNNEISLNGYYVYVFDTLTYYFSDTSEYYDFKNYRFSEKIDSTKMQRVIHGRYRFEVHEKKREGYYLAEYKGGVLVGKRYDFDEKGNLISTFARYPKIRDSIFKGSQRINYDKNQRIKSIEYFRFNEDQDNTFFWYDIYYNEKGILKYCSYYNDKEWTSYHSSYSDSGELISEYKRTPKESYEKKWSRNGKKLKTEVYENRERIIRIYKNDVLIREKIK